MAKRKKSAAAPNEKVNRSAAAAKVGRPPGAKTQKVETVEKTLSQCKGCGSTDRTPYFCRKELERADEIDGGPYTHVVWQRTHCRQCNRLRVDKSFENRT